MNDRKKWLDLHDFHVNVSKQCSYDTPLPDCVTGKLLFKNKSLYRFDIVSVLLSIAGVKASVVKICMLVLSY